MREYVLVKEWFSSEPTISASNRGFLYGDGFFETLLVKDGELTYWDLRKQRISRTIKFLRTDPIDLDLVESAVQAIWTEEREPWARLRLTFFRQGQGRYLPEGDEVGVVAQWFPLDGDPMHSLGSKSVDLGSTVLPTSHEGNYKLIAKHWQVLAAKEAHERKLDDLILLNSTGEVVESIAGNLFFQFGDSLITPWLDAGCLDGVARKVLLDLSHVHEGRLKMDHILHADAAFTVNSVQGLVPLEFGKLRSDAARFDRERRHLEERRKRKDGVLSSILGPRGNLP